MENGKNTNENEIIEKITNTKNPFSKFFEDEKLSTTEISTAVITGSVIH
ncbi:MAG: hypothetical protein KGY67_08455 [Candidatus Thermoplasmatota archaeon]|nr:hypothetical protein [Candidatus Thermoplasmatota archaeon]